MKLFILIRRDPAETHEEFMHWWSYRHAPLASKLPGLLSYILHEVTHGFERDVEWDGVAELEFGSVEDATTAFESPEGIALMADAAGRRGARVMLSTQVLRVVVEPVQPDSDRDTRPDGNKGI
jgi:uncharacterized protein (TIGR02118 family)